MFSETSATSAKRPLSETGDATKPAKRARGAMALPLPTRTSGAEDTDLTDKLSTVISITTRGHPSKEVRTVQLHLGLLKDKVTHLHSLAQGRSTPDLKLLHIDSEAFSVFANWLYRRSVNLTPDTQTGDPGDILQSVLECYCLAKALQCPDFSNDVMRRACAVSAEDGLMFRNEAIDDIYQRTASLRDCALRKWIVDEWVWQYDCESIDELEWEANSELVHGFLWDVMKEQAARIGGEGRARTRAEKRHRSTSSKVKSYME